MFHCPQVKYKRFQFKDSGEVHMHLRITVFPEELQETALKQTL